MLHQHEHISYILQNKINIIGRKNQHENISYTLQNKKYIYKKYY
jgi:hypothetical protein